MIDIDLKKCNVLKSSNHLFVDIDDTLILWDSVIKFNKNSLELPIGNLGNFDINLTRNGRILIEDPYINNYMLSFKPHVSHCNILIRNYHQGRTIVVWSAAGCEWASIVIKTLGLEKYVSLIMEKPSITMDDRPLHTWTTKNIYLHKDTEG